MMPVLYILNGPNLNLLKIREPEKYGRTTLQEIEKTCRAAAKAQGFDIVFLQSNIEGELVNFIQDAHAKGAAGIVINPAGYTTTSVAILDALLAVKLPVVEIHITNIHAREKFRQESLVSRAANAVMCGFGANGYKLAIEGIAAIIKASPATPGRKSAKKKK